MQFLAKFVAQCRHFRSWLVQLVASSGAQTMRAALAYLALLLLASLSAAAYTIHLSTLFR